MTPFGAYRCYLAMKSHFTTDRYDIIKYRGRTDAKQGAFEKRRDRYRFESMANNLTDKQIVETFIANFTRYPRYSGPFDDQTEKRYNDWLKHNQALTYNFGNEVKNLFEENSQLCYNDVFFSGDGQHPPVLTAYLGQGISIETFVILDRLNSFTQQMVGDVVTEGILRTARKYDPFLQVDLETYDGITQRIREQVF
jgi:hypothetical protein